MPEFYNPSKILFEETKKIKTSFTRKDKIPAKLKVAAKQTFIEKEYSTVFIMKL